MRLLLVLFLFMCFFSTSISAQKKYKKEVKTFQKSLNKQYKSKDKSPLKPDERKKFKKHNFFPYDATYRVEAKFERFSDAELVHMETSSDRIADYDKYGVATFEWNGQHFQLNIYQSHRTRTMPMYRDHLFLPFTDLTTGEESYGAGRYIDLKIPKGETLVIDFNKSYHPYCAYTDGYSCPITPSDNFLNTRVEAGIRF